MEWLAGAGFGLALPFAGCKPPSAPDASEVQNVFDLENLSRRRMSDDAIWFLNGGADDERTARANCDAFRTMQIRARRLVDVSEVSTRVEMFGETLDNPILLGPVGCLRFFHPDGEMAVAQAAVARNHQLILSTVSNFSVTDVVARSGANPWFQLYPTPERKITRKLLDRAGEAGCKVCVLTVDTPVFGNRETSAATLRKMVRAGNYSLGNFEDGLPEGMRFFDPTLTWDIVGWLRENCGMKVVLKGIVTREDAALAVRHGVDGLIVSNHGGRQLESDRATLDCLPEIVAEVGGAIPVLIDGGIRRGTDIFKALALGARAVCIGRPYCWGLGALGREGVELALEILKTELVRDMQLAGAVSIANITRDHVTSAR